MLSRNNFIFTFLVSTGGSVLDLQHNLKLCVINGSLDFFWYWGKSLDLQLNLRNIFYLYVNTKPKLSPAVTNLRANHYAAYLLVRYKVVITSH